MPLFLKRKTDSLTSPEINKFMTLFSNIPAKGTITRPVVTIGNFDGIHIGHRKILQTLREKAAAVHGEPVVVTFAQHPRKVLNPDNPPLIVTTADEKLKILAAMGFTSVILLNFSREMANMNALDFYNRLLIEQLGAEGIVIGYDHAFGKNREGNLKFLQSISEQSGITVTHVTEELIGTRPVSSTWLREEITSGNMEMTSHLLGRRYSISGNVSRGHGRGRNIGFPTANILIDDTDKLLPPDGVYAVNVYLDRGKQFGGMLNIGSNPTFGNLERSIEVNIFDFNDDIYDSEITVEFYSRIRNEIRFKNAEELKKQLQKDHETSQRLLQEFHTG